MTRFFKLCLVSIFCYTFAITFVSAPAYADTNDNYNILVWSDEFDGNSLDSSKWGFDVGNNGFGNNELQYYVGGDNNINVSDGMLTITAKKEGYQDSQYTSAKVWTKDLQAFKYGKITARMKIPTGQGIWPAFCMLGNSYNWPKCDKIDIMGHINNEPNVYGSAHWSNTDNEKDLKSKSGGTKDLDLSEFHEYSIIWDKNSITWYCDGTQYNKVSKDDFSNDPDAFSENFFLILNVAIGSDWPGSPDSSTVFPARMLVDYIRVYQKDSSNSEASSESKNTTSKSKNTTNSNINNDVKNTTIDNSTDNLNTTTDNSSNSIIDNDSNTSKTAASTDSKRNDTTPGTSDSYSDTFQVCFIISIISGLLVIALFFIKKKKTNKNIFL